VNAPGNAKTQISVTAKGAAIAEENRRAFEGKGLFVLNVIGSPGCGKTALLEATAKRFGPRMAVIEGDVRTTLDAERIESAGARAVQIETGGACHLDPAQVRRAASQLDLAAVDVLFIENVGNLVCPAAVELGADVKVAMVSTPEGDEKPAKYPALFIRAGAVIINKIDLLPHLDYSLERASGDCGKLNSNAAVMPLSCKTGEGLEAWFKFVERGIAGKKALRAQ
jgi:hydrogenase nickel incorporation protein HypB